MSAFEFDQRGQPSFVCTLQTTSPVWASFMSDQEFRDFPPPKTKCSSPMVPPIFNPTFIEGLATIGVAWCSLSEMEVIDVFGSRKARRGRAEPTHP